MIGIIQAGDQAIADRFAFLPAIGLFIVVAWAVADLAARRAWSAAGLQTASVLTLGTCALLTSQQLSYWQDTVTLFEHALAVTPHNATACLALGVGLQSQGCRTGLRTDQVSGNPPGQPPRGSLRGGRTVCLGRCHRPEGLLPGLQSQRAGTPRGKPGTPPTVSCRPSLSRTRQTSSTRRIPTAIQPATASSDATTLEMGSPSGR